MYGYTTIAVAVGILLDFIVGDPHKIPHPVCFIGKLITALEIRFRMLFPDTAKGKRLAGISAPAAGAAHLLPGAKRGVRR